MRVEWPELKRCCCCMPLRHGLITWGYIRLIIELLLTALVTDNIVYVISNRDNYPPDTNGFIENAMVNSVFLTVLVVDDSFTLVFIIGGHRKSAKLLHVYYIYSFVSLGLIVLANIGIAVLDIIQLQNELKYSHNPTDAGISFILSCIRLRLLFGICLIGIHVYIILLTRSEVNKLKNISKYRYTNPLPEAQGSVENGTVDRGDNDAVETPSNEPDAQFQGVIDQIMNHKGSYTC